MDDDDLRRGKPTSHKAFGEASAILSGDGLLTRAFELISSKKMKEKFGSEKLIDSISLLSSAAGPSGMVGGQYLDIKADPIKGPNANQAIADAVSALVNLGYGRSEAYTAVTQAVQRLGDSAVVEMLIKEGLSELAAFRPGDSQ